MKLTLLLAQQAVDVEIQKTASGFELRYENKSASITLLSYQAGRMVLAIDHKTYECFVGSAGQNQAVSLHYRDVAYQGERLNASRASFEASLLGGASTLKSGQIRSIMPGKIVETMVKLGDQVDSQQTLLVMEAMKMENEIKASHSGIVKEIHVQAGQSVETNTLLMQLEPLR